MVDLPNFTKFQKKMLSSLLALCVLVVGMAVGTALVMKPQDIRQQASETAVDLNLAGPASVAPGAQFQVNVVATNLHAHQVTAADIRVNYDNTKLTLNNVVPGQFFNRRSAMQRAVPGNEPAIRFPNISEPNRIALGAFCDYCYLGPSPLPTQQPPAPTPSVGPCGTVDPACYPISTANQGTDMILATYTFTALANASGTASITFDNTNTQVASIGNDTNVVGDRIGTSVTINAVVPTATPTGVGPSACSADINQDGTVTTTDYTILRNNYLQSPPTYPRADINGDGTVTTTDYTILRNFYLQTCAN